MESPVVTLREHKRIAYHSGLLRTTRLRHGANGLKLRDVMFKTATIRLYVLKCMIFPKEFFSPGELIVRGLRALIFPADVSLVAEQQAHYNVTVIRLHNCART